MSRKQRRAIFIGLGVAVLSLAVLLVLMALRDTVVFFLTPQEVMAKGIEPGKRFRLGGLVGAGSVKRGAGATVEFSVTDAGGAIPVRYTGVLPDLFREGQGVVTEGRLDTSGHFIADTVLAKHDETYMPPEVARKLKEQGVWQGADNAKPQSGPKPKATP